MQSERFSHKVKKGKIVGFVLALGLLLGFIWYIGVAGESGEKPAVVIEPITK